MAMVLVAGALFRANAAGRDPEAPREARGGDAACGSRRRDVRTLVFHCRCVRRYSARRSRDRQVELVDLVLGQVRYGCVDPAVTAPRLRSLPRQSFSPTKCLFCVFTLNRHRHSPSSIALSRLGGLRGEKTRSATSSGAARCSRGARRASSASSRPGARAGRSLSSCSRPAAGPRRRRLAASLRSPLRAERARVQLASRRATPARRGRGRCVGRAVWRLSPPQPSRARSVCGVNPRSLVGRLPSLALRAVE
jgi:hypothetical protein